MSVEGELVVFEEFKKDRIKKYLLSITAAAAYTLLTVVPGLQPDIMVAGIPIYGINKEGHAISDEILKYRSMGGIFLAHQKGGKKTFIFKAWIKGPYRLIILGILKGLLRRGREQYEIAGNLIDVKAGVKNLTTENFDQTRSSLERYIENFDGWREERIGFHKTYSIITDTKIYTNMYMETLTHVEDMRIGKDAIEIRCAFREFYPPLQMGIVKDTKKKNPKHYFKTWIPKKDMASYGRYDTVSSGIWAGRDFFKLWLKKAEKKPTESYQMEMSYLIIAMAATIGYTRL